MSYVLHIWEQPQQSPPPANAEEALSTLDNLRLSTFPQNPRYLSLAQRLTSRYPCISSPEAKAVPES